MYQKENAHIYSVQEGIKTGYKVKVKVYIPLSLLSDCCYFRVGSFLLKLQLSISHPLSRVFVQASHFFCYLHLAMVAIKMESKCKSFPQMKSGEICLYHLPTPLWVEFSFPKASRKIPSSLLDPKFFSPSKCHIPAKV